MTLPMLRILPPPWDFRMMTTPGSGRSSAEEFNSDKYESIRKLAMVPIQPPRNPNKPFTSFRINDILSSEGESPSPPKAHRLSSKNDIHPTPPNGLHRRLSPPSAHESSSKLHRVQNLHRHLQHQKHSDRKHHSHHHRHDHGLPPPQPSKIIRPWDASPSPGKNSEASSDADDEEINVDDDDEPMPKGKGFSLKDVSPLDALMEMANKTFQGLETSEAADAKRREQAAMFGKHSAPKKRRKSRTAFTNQQIYELEKRFLYQKYLTPADRDEIAQSLNLTNAQVITWFQNRRAKLKRDLEELKNDVVATKQLSTKSGSSDHEFSVDSDTDSHHPSSYGPLPGSPNRCRSESRSPEPEVTHSGNEVDFSRHSAEMRCVSPEEIVVDDKIDDENADET